MNVIALYRGSRGKGKTLTMVKDSLKFYQRGFKVLTNLTSLKFGEKVDSDYILSLSRKSELFNCVLVIDEIELFFDSREFSKKENKEFSKFLQQIRKRNVNILCTCQYINLIDLRIRQQLDVIVYPHHDSRYNSCGAVYIDLTTLEDDFRQVDPRMSLVVYNKLPVFNLYDTNEMLK